jgi:voltage-gated potassium channel Kch
VKKKSHFVVVERNPNNGFIARTRAMGVKVVTRDIAEDGLFDRLALTHAESFIIFTNSDAENVEVALKLRQHLRLLDRRKLRLRVHIHLDGIGKLTSSDHRNQVSTFNQPPYSIQRTHSSLAHEPLSAHGIAQPYCWHIGNCHG